MKEEGREGRREEGTKGDSLVTQEVLGHRIKVHPRYHSHLDIHVLHSVLSNSKLTCSREKHT